MFLSFCFNTLSLLPPKKVLFEQLLPYPWFQGVYFWLWKADAWHGGPSDASFTPHGKQAERVFRQFATNSSAPYTPRMTQNVTYDAASVGPADPDARAAAKGKINGVMLGANAYSVPTAPYGSDMSLQAIAAIRRTGASHVALFPSWFKEKEREQ